MLRKTVFFTLAIFLIGEVGAEVSFEIQPFLSAGFVHLLKVLILVPLHFWIRNFLQVVFCQFQANFEDTRCRCVCPSTMYFVGDNATEQSDNHRRYYTMTNIGPSFCNPQSVVKGEVTKYVDETHMDAFLANCDCRFESRNTVMLKVVVIFVICVIMLLVTYMAFLLCLDPMLRKQRFQSSYRQQTDEMEDNIFARATESSSAESTAPTNMRARAGSKSSLCLYFSFFLFLDEYQYLPCRCSWPRGSRAESVDEKGRRAKKEHLRGSYNAELILGIISCLSSFQML
ncbi:unnamed protein product [Strongylus vulgaris]|uniref:TMEM9 family protein n=1 Tax=Strongylus vulgaris TaxID=40348 RepID=A0A3P7KC73_STRVU|nr:unnamed protein product [Strongylus vulgaris]